MCQIWPPPHLSWGQAPKDSLDSLELWGDPVCGLTATCSIHTTNFTLPWDWQETPRPNRLSLLLSSP